MRVYNKGGAKMNELIFQVEFLSDIVLPATSNTEGKIEQLDFIPGTAFLGMAAVNYLKYENSFDIFHSGKVRFGDASLLSGDIPTYKMPLCFFHEKTDETKIRNQLFSLSDLTQPKQLREGYITTEFERLHIEYNYTQKSAYDKENRRSKDSSMYGYKAIKSGTKWQFTLKYADIAPADVELLKTTLESSTRLGKSKSAQYGKVKLTCKGLSENIEDINLQNEIVLYANSRLALVDEEGNPTYNLKYLCKGLTDINIVYEKTQIRTSTFTPFNTTRKTKDYERICINKGSVIVLKDLTQAQLDTLKSGVGAYLSEGFGEVLINPSFLKQKEIVFQKESENEKQHNRREVINKSFNDSTLQFLANRHNANIKKLKVANEVAKFISETSSVDNKQMNSQWGSIRSLCATSTDETIEANIKEYISHGVAKEEWKDAKGSTLLQAIANSSNKIAFTKLLCMQMPKVKDMNKEQNND
jgi:CRISPR/Cas system CSM-associated protein Csm3 (group 7 of RAMP superfamily)